jgi:hypothetical protein
MNVASTTDISKPNTGPTIVDPFTQAPSNVKVEKPSKDADLPKVLKVDDAYIETDNQQENEFMSRYPFDDLDVGEGFFVANKDEPKIDSLIDYMNREIHRARDFYSMAERSENGDEILEEVYVKSKKLVNGKPELDSLNQPIINMTSTLIPKRIYSRHFSAYEVVKDDVIGEGVEAPDDGVLVIRES